MSEAIGQPGQAALPRPLGIGEILSTALQLYRRHWRTLLAVEYDPHPPFGGIDWGQVDRDIYEPMLGPMVQQQLADRPELLAKLSG